MGVILWLMIVCGVTFVGIKWILPRLVSWYLIKKYKVHIQFGRISFPCSLRDVVIRKSGYAVHVDEICIRSSFFNSDVTKLLSINIRDVRVTKTLTKKAATTKSPSTDAPTAPGNRPNTPEAASSTTTSALPPPVDFRQRKVPPSIMTFAQFIAVHVHQVAVTVISDLQEPRWRMHATVQEVHLDGSIVQNAKSLIVTASLNDARAKLLRQNAAQMPKADGGAHASTSSTSSQPQLGRQTSKLNFSPLKVWPMTSSSQAASSALRKNPAANAAETCLVELCFGIALDGVILAHTAPTLEKIQLNMNHTKTTVHDALFDFVRDMKVAKADEEASERLAQVGRPKRKTDSGSYRFASDDGDDLYARMAPVIPKNFRIQIDSALITSVKTDASEDFTAKLKSFAVNGKLSPSETRAPTDPALHSPVNVLVKLALQHLEIDTKHERFLFVEEFTVDTKLESDTVNTYFKLKTFQLIYNHAVIYDWVRTNLFAIAAKSGGNGASGAKPLSLILPGSPESGCGGTAKQSRSGWLERTLRHVTLKGCAELWNVSVLTKIDEHTAWASVSHTKLLLEQFNEQRSSRYHRQRRRWANLVLANRHWSTELMIESLWWSLDNQTREHNLKKMHQRGSPLFVGVCLVKLSSYGNATKLDLSVHTLRTEWSGRLAAYVLRLRECAALYGYGCGERAVPIVHQRDAEDDGAEDADFFVTAKVSDVSAYFVNQHDACMVLSFNESSLACTAALTVFNLDGMQSAIYSSQVMAEVTQQQQQQQSPSPVVGQPHVFGNIKAVRMECLRPVATSDCDDDSAQRQLTVHVLEDSELMWNPNLHMHVVTLVRDMLAFRDTLRPAVVRLDIGQPIVIDNDDDVTAAIATTNAARLRAKPSVSIGFDMYVEGNTVLGLKLSERHSMQVFVENAYISRRPTSHNRWLISIEKIFINIDDMHIFTIREIESKTAASQEVLRQERLNYEHFVLPVNHVWMTTVGCFHGCFPYAHDFSDAVQNELNSTFKWLKSVHGISKRPFTERSPLPSDMVVQVKEFLLELSDDPFEVKLRDNYVLLVDEHHESLKRQNLFEAKIREILLLPAGTIEELRANLVRKNSEIYVQRSQKINEAGPTRTRLIAWLLTDLQVMAMADPSVHGKRNVVRMMRDIDAETPWPEEGLDFVTLWCRAVNVSCSEWKFMLRDFPQPMFQVKQMRLFGNLCGAEQVSPPRAKRDVVIEVGAPFGAVTVQRGMTSLKFYHDFDCEYDLCSYAFGPCWEPVMAQCNLSFEKISSPSKDPSPTLPFWDKMRLLFHGRLTMIAKQFTVLLHASLDPYNTTEEMELSWHNCGIVWTNAKWMFKGELNVCVRTASRYDDCRLLHFPNLKLTLKLNWICLANPNDHHAVIPCAPDKLPEYSSNQVHDSYRAFRSQNLNVWISFDTKPVPGQSPGSDVDLPNLVLYGSTLRWFESLKLILSGITRPTRRGPVFNNVRPRKKQLSRHYRKAHLQMSLHKFQVLYWMSHALHRGFELNGGRVTFSSEHTLTMHAIDDGLRHRPRANWATMYMNCELNDAEIWLKSVLNEKMQTAGGSGGSGTGSSCENIAADNPDALRIVKFYFLSLAKVSYGREALVPLATSAETKQKDTPVHKLVVYDLKGAWTKNNRDVAFALFDSFMKTQKLKNNLSTDALKGFRKESTVGPVGSPIKTATASSAPSTSSSSSTRNRSQDKQQSSNKQQTSHAAKMLQQLIAESDHKFNVYSDDLSTHAHQQQLQGLQACQSEDVTQYNWFISLVNSQVLLKGTETSGYVILSAAKAEILQRVHRPAWRDRSLVSKTTWMGFLECMQYYATVSPGEHESLLDENIMWLTLDNIEEKDREPQIIAELPDVPQLVGSGHSVGGVVSETVGGPGIVRPGQVLPVQLQRIVSRCKCEFFYVSYGDTSIDPSEVTEVPPPPSDDTCISPWEQQDDPVDAFTLMHHDLDVCTNSLQYAMILDIVNNLMLFVEPQRKQALERLARMRFQLHLRSGEDQKRPIQQLQTQVRSLMSSMRRLEREIHIIGKQRAEEGDSEALRHEYDEVRLRMVDVKERLSNQSEELDMMLSCYNETQLSAMNKLATVRQDKPITIVRTNEICFKHAQWRLTEADGQIGIADLILSNFLYTKKSKSDDSVEHLLELGYIRMNNLIPRENFKEVLCPTEIQKDMPVDHQRVIRVFCREKQPVGGISVKEHFEINVVPITIAITKKFYSTMLKFCFPDRDQLDAADAVDDLDVVDGGAGSGGGGGSGGLSAAVSNSSLASSSKRASTSAAANAAAGAASMSGASTSSSSASADGVSMKGSTGSNVASSSGPVTSTAATAPAATGSTTTSRSKRTKDSEFYVKIEKDDVEKMKERAEKNKLFIYIKIPEVPVRVSYKGNKEKNLEDITDFSLVIPTLEYHNVTWTWLDLLMAMKSDSRRVIFSQAIKQKLQINRHKPLSSIGERASPQEEDKARILFGNRHAVENKSQRKGVFSSKFGSKQ